MKTCAIIVAAGKGTRMKSDCPKQFIEVKNRPILYYTLNAFQKSKVDEVIVVVSKGYQEYVQKDIVGKFKLDKVKKIVLGGAERYLSVYEGIKAAEGVDYVLVHDGARPFIEPVKINEVIEQVQQYQAVIVGVKAKDTMKIVNEDGYVIETPNRSMLWNVQTPQAFEYNLLKTAYNKIVVEKISTITDDAMVVEYATDQKIKMLEGSYRNIKITTIEDLREEDFENMLQTVTKQTNF